MKRKTTNMRKRKFKVYVTATIGTAIEIEARSPEEAEAIAEERWTTGKGGAIVYEDMEATDVNFSAIEV